MLPYTFDLSLYHQIKNKDLIDHILRVGKVFYTKIKVSWRVWQTISSISFKMFCRAFYYARRRTRLDNLLKSRWSDTFVGAGVLVNKNVADHALIVGNPAKQIEWVREYI